MNPEIAKMILEFMKRTELKGVEVDAFNTCVKVLQDVIYQPQQELYDDTPPA